MPGTATTRWCERWRRGSISMYSLLDALLGWSALFAASKLKTPMIGPPLNETKPVDPREGRRIQRRSCRHPANQISGHPDGSTARVQESWHRIHPASVRKRRHLWCRMQGLARCKFLREESFQLSLVHDLTKPY